MAIKEPLGSTAKTREDKLMNKARKMQKKVEDRRRGKRKKVKSKRKKKQANAAKKPMFTHAVVGENEGKDVIHAGAYHALVCMQQARA